MLPARAEGAGCAGSGPTACPPPETCSGSSPVPVLLRGLRAEKGLISRQNGKPWLQQHHVGSEKTGGGAAAAARPPPRAPRGLTRVEVGAEGEAGVEEGRRHGQGRQRDGHPRGRRCAQAQNARGLGRRPGIIAQRPPQVRSARPPLLAPPATAAARAPVGAATDEAPPPAAAAPRGSGWCSPKTRGSAREVEGGTEWEGGWRRGHGGWGVRSRDKAGKGHAGRGQWGKGRGHRSRGLWGEEMRTEGTEAGARRLGTRSGEPRPRRSA